jgi:GT2 family glycosyltransferase
MSANPVISFCIVSYNSQDYLKDCLSSLVTYSPRVSYEIIIVDNNSTDGSIEMIRSAHPEINLEVVETHEGYTRAMNRAMRQARGMFLIQLNPDTLVKPGAWDTLIDFLSNRSEVGICTPKVLNRDESLQKQCRRSAAGPWDTFCYISGLSRLFPNNRHLAGYLMTYMDEDIIHPCEAVSGSCMMIRREVVNQIGYLDEAFFAYQEDSDYCFRARLAGFQVYYMPLAQIVHYGGQGGSLVNARRSIYEWHRSYWIYYQKHFKARELFFINWLVYLAIAMRLVLKLGASLFKKQKYIGSRKP